MGSAAGAGAGCRGGPAGRARRPQARARRRPHRRLGSACSGGGGRRRGRRPQGQRQATAPWSAGRRRRGGGQPTVWRQTATATATGRGGDEARAASTVLGTGAQPTDRPSRPPRAAPPKTATAAATGRTGRRQQPRARGAPTTARARRVPPRGARPKWRLGRRGGRRITTGAGSGRGSWAHSRGDRGLLSLSVMLATVRCLNFIYIWSEGLWEVAHGLSCACSICTLPLLSATVIAIRSTQPLKSVFHVLKYQTLNHKNKSLVLMQNLGPQCSSGPITSGDVHSWRDAASGQSACDDVQFPWP